MIIWDTPPAEEVTMITEVEVDHLRWQAAAADDRATEHLCERALLGDLKAWRECERLLLEEGAR